ncbi:MAG: hypothetical protein HY898_17035 [Deltaproteobacteria bacterium]|nr:hypothetical protein [Deltaproteobacteria bacterium]
MPADPDDVIALIIASALTLLIFNAAGAVVVWALWRSERRMRARHPDIRPQRDSLVWVYYVLSLLLWPAALALCLVFQGKPETSRTGAMCGTLGVAQVMAIAWVTCSVVALFARDIVPYLP